MGFSLIGSLIAIIILAPSMLMIIFPPEPFPVGLQDAGKIFTLLERAGQLGCIGILVVSRDAYTEVNYGIWAVLILLFIAVYYGLWIRYVVQGRAFRLLWEPFVGIPIPMAILPVCAFGFAAIWGESIWLGLAVVCLAIGHFTNSWHNYQHAKDQ